MNSRIRRAFYAVALVALVLPPLAVAESAGSFESTGHLADGVRQWHAALRLLDGRVFVVGGSGGADGNALGAAELFDPGTGTWTVAATMATRRSLTSAHLLPDGRVLVVGGAAEATVHASTELWDPASPGGFTAGAPLSIPRFRPAGVTLADGRVLIAGGMSSNAFIDPTTSAEVYDAGTNTWSPVASMVLPRQATAHVLLADGTVLVTGGDQGHWNGFAQTRTCQRYDPVADTWTLVADMADARHNHAAVRLLDGRVLVVGGLGQRSTELYDPVANTWTPAGTIGSGGDLPTLTLLADGRVLAAGGYDGGHLSTADLFDPATGAWTALPPMSRARFAHSATLLVDGRVVLAGGHVNHAAPHWTDACELFTPGDVDAAPIANAGPDVSIHAGDAVTLDGTASSDDNTPTGDLGFAWAFVSKPVGSAAVLVDGDTAMPSFTADQPGTYVLELVVTDGASQASTDHVVVSSENLAPTAEAGPDLAATVGTPVSLSGAASDPEDDVLTVMWTLVSSPAGSSATLTGADTPTPSLTPDVAGVYVLGLVASDPWAESEEDLVVVTAVLAGASLEELLREASDALAALPGAALDAPGHRVAFAAQVSTALRELARYRAGEADALLRAADHVRRLLERTDGFPLRGALDTKGASKDWIVTSAGQHAVYAPLRDALDAMTS